MTENDTKWAMIEAYMGTLEFGAPALGIATGLMEQNAIILNPEFSADPAIQQVWDDFKQLVAQYQHARDAMNERFPLLEVQR